MALVSLSGMEEQGGNSSTLFRASLHTLLGKQNWVGKSWCGS